MTLASVDPVHRARRNSGYDVERVEAYRAEPARELGEELADALREGRLDGALFFSERTAAALVALVTAAGLEESLGRLPCYALSPRTAAPLRNLAGELHVAEKPDSVSLLALLPGAVKP